MDRFQNTRQPDWDWWGRLWPTPGETLRELGLVSGESLVEIGSGNGYFALPAARIVAPGPVYALDVDPELVTELSQLAAQQELHNLEPVVGDARSLAEHLPETVDTAMLANTFHGVADPPTLLDSVVEALAAGGRFVVINWQPRSKEATTVAGKPRGPPTDRRLSQPETRAVIEEATALNVAEQIDLPPYHYALVFER